MPAIEEEETGYDMQRRSLVLLQEAIYHLDPDIVLICFEDIAQQELLGAMGDIVLGVEVVVLKIRGKVEVGAQRVIDQLMRRALDSDDVVQLAPELGLVIQGVRDLELLHCCAERGFAGCEVMFMFTFKV